MGFREFYETCYQAPTPCVTTADEMRGVVCAYQQFRLYLGLTDRLASAEREAFFAEKMEYHIGACELAELSGDTARTIKHREAFLEVWKRWFEEITEEEGKTLFSPGQIGFWRRFMKKVRQWSRFKG